MILGTAHRGGKAATFSVDYRVNNMEKGIDGKVICHSEERLFRHAGGGFT
jgi:hypothetical protein